jgi:N-formylglutamate deformylase
MMPPPFTLLRPAKNAIPLLLDSPHSGTFYPDDFAAVAPLDALRTAEDTHVDSLFADAVDLGATMLCAHYPRAYIDCNRSERDIDTSMLSDKWHGAIQASEKTKLGYGLIWRKLDDGRDIYSRQLTAAEVQRRIEDIYRPYWRALIDEAQRLHREFGVLYHFNCHSMPARATHASHLPRGTPHADIVLGDRCGSTCAPWVTDALDAAFRAQGLQVKRNDPYQGVEIVRALGRPREHFHSIQIEINRGLYMDEATRERNASFMQIAELIRRVLQQFIANIAQRNTTSFESEHSLLSPN